MKSLFFAVVLGLLASVAGAGNARADEALRRIQQSLRDQGFYYGPIDGAPGDETTHAIRRYQIRNGLAVTGELNDETARSIARNGGSAAKSGNANASSLDDDRRYANGNAGTAPGRATPAPAPAYHPPPPSDPSDPPDPGYNAVDDDAPVARAPVDRPDLRVAPPSSGAGAAPPRNGIPPSPALTAVFERTPYEFAPPPVQTDILRRAQAILLRDGFYDGEANGRPNPVTFEAVTNFQGVNHLRRTGRFDVATLAVMRLMPDRRAMPGRAAGPVYEGRLAQ